MHKRTLQTLLRLAAAITPLLAAAVLCVPAALSSAAGESRATAVVTYRSHTALRAALERYPARIVKRLPDVRAVEVRPQDPGAFAEGIQTLPGIVSVDLPERRFSAGSRVRQVSHRVERPQGASGASSSPGRSPSAAW